MEQIYNFCETEPNQACDISSHTAKNALKFL